MAEYTYEDIIMDPEDPRLKGTIGKECYFSDYPKKILDVARNNSSEYIDCLTNISKERACPFYDKNGNGWTLIIIKKEEPNKMHVPFESIKEFIDRYTESKEGAEFGSFNYNLYQCGMWLKRNNSDAYFMVTEIWDEGVVISDVKINTTRTSDDNFFTINELTKWKELNWDYSFLDGTPCGRIVKESEQ